MNVKKGDLAIITDCVVQENLGKICQVGEFVGEMFPVNGKVRKNCWRVHFPGGVISVFLGTIMYDTYAPDSWLKPVSGLPETDDTNTTLDKPVDCEELT